MRQIQIRKLTKRTTVRELDLRSPSGRLLPFCGHGLYLPSPLTVRLARCPGRCHATISVERKRGHGQRQRGQLHQQQQVVITGNPVEPKATTVGTSVDEDPPALPANGDGDRLHPAGAGSAPITGDVAIEVPGPKAGGAVIAMGCARRVVGYGYAAVRALEGA